MMKLRNQFCITLVFLIFTGITAAQSGWVLRLHKDGIKVYTKNSSSSSIQSVKAEYDLETSMSTLALVLLDVNESKEWIYATKKVSVLQQLSSTELIYYSEISLPWPVSNRDFIAQFSITQDSLTKTLKAITTNKPGWLPPLKGIVRVKEAHSQWVVTQLNNNTLHVEYELMVDPGGNLPVWLINMFATTGPYYTFQKLRKQVKKPEYCNRVLTYIKN